MRTKACMLVGFALSLLIVTAPAAAQKQYLILTPSAWTETLKPLIRLREAGGYSVTVQTTDYLESGGTPLPAEVIQRLIARRRPAVCLLVGDVPENMPEKLKPLAIPTRIIDGKVYGGRRSVDMENAFPRAGLVLSPE